MHRERENNAEYKRKKKKWHTHARRHIQQTKNECQRQLHTESKWKDEEKKIVTEKNDITHTHIDRPNCINAENFYARFMCWNWAMFCLSHIYKVLLEHFFHFRFQFQQIFRWTVNSWFCSIITTASMKWREKKTIAQQIKNKITKKMRINLHLHLLCT